MYNIICNNYFFILNKADHLDFQEVFCELRFKKSILRGKPDLKPEKIYFSIISQVIMFLNLYKKQIYTSKIYIKHNMLTLPGSYILMYKCII